MLTFNANILLCDWFCLKTDFVIRKMIIRLNRYNVIYRYSKSFSN